MAENMNTQDSTMSPRKVPRNSDFAERKEHISNLPDDVIPHILSRTPTMYAIRTSVLSKYWQDKWKSIYNININDRELLIRKRSVDQPFIDFVEKMTHSEKILSFSLSFWRCYGGRLGAWICNIYEHNIENFRLFYTHDDVFFSLTVFTSSSLKRLELVMPGGLGVSSKTFPYVTYLYLDGLRVVSGERKLQLEFPNLKKLKLRLCVWNYVKTVEIHAPALTTFKSETSDEAAENRCKIKIVGANLVKFGSSGGLRENCILTGSTVVYASMLKYYMPDDELYYKKFGRNVRNLMKGFNGLKYLIISGCLSQAIAISRKPHLPVYDKLEKLVVHSPGYFRALLELLSAAQSLKLLVIDRIAGDGYNYDYEAIESLPSCLVRHLEEIKINYFSWTDQFHLEKFLLKNGRQLKKVYISGYDCMPKEEIVERLSAFPADSTCLTIVAN